VRASILCFPTVTVILGIVVFGHGTGFAWFLAWLGTRPTALGFGGRSGASYARTESTNQNERAWLTCRWGVTASRVSRVSDSSQRTLTPPPVRSIIVSSRSLLPQIVELDEFGRVSVRQQILADPEEVLSELSQSLDETFGLLFAPLLVDTFRYRALDQSLQSLARIVAGVVQLKP
jgi:hypothetical protein